MLDVEKDQQRGKGALPEPLIWLLGWKSLFF